MFVHLPTLERAVRLTLRPDTTPPVHLAFASFFLLGWLGLLPLVAVARGLDRALYPGFRQQRIVEPLFIMAAPRSGTTFLHRLLARDERFTTITLLQSLLPAVNCYRALDGLSRLDGRLGRWGRRLMERLEGRAFQGWDGIHPIALDRPEEDEMIFLYTALSPALFLGFPFLRELRYTAFVDDMPRPIRRQLRRWYRETLKRHLYATGPDRTLLAKTVLGGGRLGLLLKTCPDMRVVHVIRDPAKTVPSALSMLSRPWRAFAPDRAGDSRQTRRLARIILRYERRMLELRRTLPASQYLELRFEELTADPAAAVERIYRHFDIPMSEPFRRELERARERSRNHQSNHSYGLDDFGLDESWLAREAADIYRAYRMPLPGA